jgi:hypothetical protein
MRLTICVDSAWRQLGDCARAIHSIQSRFANLTLLHLKLFPLEVLCPRSSRKDQARLPNLMALAKRHTWTPKYSFQTYLDWNNFRLTSRKNGKEAYCPKLPWFGKTCPSLENNSKSTRIACILLLVIKHFHDDFLQDLWPVQKTRQIRGGFCQGYSQKCEWICSNG